jgi:hypothetical protein
MPSQQRCRNRFRIPLAGASHWQTHRALSRTLELEFPMSAPWRTSEQAILIDEIRRARAPSEILIPGRTTTAILRKASRLGLVGDGVPRRPWSQADRDTLRALRAQGWTVSQMCAGPLSAYSRTAVQKQIQRLGLADPTHSDRLRKAHRLTGDVLEAFRAFLTQNARCCTPEQIALAWNEDHEPKVSHWRVLYHLEQLGLRVPRRQVLYMAYSKIKRERSKARSLAPLTEYSRSLPERNERELRELAESMRSDPTVEWQTCRDCGESWPKQPPFFYREFKPIDPAGGTVRSYLLRRCKLCCNRVRRSA